MVHTFYHQLQKARRKHGQLAHSEPFLSPCLLLTASELCASHTPTHCYYSDCFSYFCFIGRSNSHISKGKVKHSISTVATAQTDLVKFDFISLKPDRGNRVICSPTLLLLLAAALVPESHKTQLVEKQMHLNAWTDGSLLVTTDLRPGMDRAHKEG